jgi:hypothetical protein
MYHALIICKTYRFLSSRGVFLGFFSWFRRSIVTGENSAFSKFSIYISICRGCACYVRPCLFHELAPEHRFPLHRGVQKEKGIGRVDGPTFEHACLGGWMDWWVDAMGSGYDGVGSKSEMQMQVQNRVFIFNVVFASAPP